MSLTPSQHPTGKGPRTLSIGGATFDLFMNVPDTAIHDCGGKQSFALPLGGKIRVNDVIGACGGGAHNTSVGLARLGCAAAFSGVIGTDQWGEAIQRNLEQENVDTSYLTVIEHEHSSFSLILSSPSGERTILTHQSMDRHFHDVTFDRDAASSADAIYLNHIHEDTCVIEDDIVDILTALPSTHLTWNPGGKQIECGMQDGGNKRLLAQCDLLLLNKEEALAFTGADTVKNALKLLVAAGAGAICVTDGKNGTVATDGTSLYECSTLDCPVIDTTGAGDAFGTAATWALITGKDLPIALKAGTINASSVVGKIGAQDGLLTETQIQSELASTPLDVRVGIL